MKAYGTTILQVKPAPKDAINLLEKSAKAKRGNCLYTD